MLQYNIYRRHLDALGVLQVLAADVTLVTSRLWLHTYPGEIRYGQATTASVLF